MSLSSPALPSAERCTSQDCTDRNFGHGLAAPDQSQFTALDDVALDEGGPIGVEVKDKQPTRSKVVPDPARAAASSSALSK